MQPELKAAWDEIIETGLDYIPDEATIRENEEIEAYNRRLEEKYERRCERVENCGRPIHRLDPATGMRVKIIPHCDDWHQCENCRQLRVTKIASLISLVVSKGPTWMVKCKTGSSQDAAATAEGKASYLAFPLEKEDEHGNDLLVLVDHPVAGAVAVRPGDAEGWDMENVACTPEKRRFTGALRKPAAAPARAGTTVSLLSFTSEAPELVLAQKFAEAVMETTGLDPQSPKEVEEANYKRIALWAVLLREAGFVTACRYQRVKLTVLTSWNSCTFNFLKGHGLLFPKVTPKRL